MFFEVKNLQTNKSKQSIRLHENEKNGEGHPVFPKYFSAKRTAYFAVALMSSLSF